MESTLLPYDPETMEKPWIIHYSTKPLEAGHIPNDSYFSEREIPRDDHDLVKVVEKLGEKANGSSADLKIVKIPADVKWEIDEYNGQEYVQEQCRKWC